MGLEVALWKQGRTGYETGRAGARHLLAGPGRPDAVFCVTDLLACGAMDAARHEFGLRIPEDLGIIGFDDIEQASWSSYGLTTFGQPVEAIATHVVALVAKDMAEHDDRRRIFEAPFIWRKTVRGGT